MNSIWKVETIIQKRFSKYRRYIITKGRYWEEEQAKQKQKEVIKTNKKLPLITKIFYKITTNIEEVKI